MSEPFADPAEFPLQFKVEAWLPVNGRTEHFWAVTSASNRAVAGCPDVKELIASKIGLARLAILEHWREACAHPIRA